MRSNEALSRRPPVDLGLLNGLRAKTAGSPDRIIAFSFISNNIISSCPKPRYTDMNASNASAFPEAREVAAAVQGQRDLAAYLTTRTDTQRIEIYDAENKAHAVDLPTSALRLLVDILGELALGNSVKVVPVHAELTTQEAADLLNVSRPHLVKLLEEGALPHFKTGRHRRVLFSDLMAFKSKRDEASRKAMDDLSQLSEELGMGY